MLSIFRRACDRLVDDQSRQRMSLVVPHIRRAMILSRLLDGKTSAAGSFAETLDGLRIGICLIEANGRIVHANNACRTVFRSGEFLSCAGKRVTARDAKTDGALHELLTAAHSDAASATRSAALPLRAPDGTRYVVHVLPLKSDARRCPSTGNTATAALLIRKATIDGPAAPDIIARSYDLTPKELQVLLAIVDVGGVPEVAVALGIAETTVKTHLARLFYKTGVKRQADLVKIVAGFSTPLAD